MSTRRFDSAPTFQLIEDDKALVLLSQEIKKLKPKIEVTLENSTIIAKGVMIDWQPTRHFFSVEWTKIDEAFEHKIESQSELRVFIKAQLLSAQIVFKTIAVRRPQELLYHFRIPQQIYRKQMRGALRVPVADVSAKLYSASKEEFEILDLSVGGARLKKNASQKKSRLGQTLKLCSLKLSRKMIESPEFEAKITSDTDDSLGVRFSGLTPEDKITLKQFLIEALHRYYKKGN